ncbi:hypothetical protein E2C01_055601 [Portunus trituberculatus]|uniref:PiggyBac transposable element-derived protein 4 n=1 Tax=Portunus trituberculatus TaxID=210409 RepID=A0A5B7GXA5_PORTR|nr:hypothetical protein [Portunus trituberculatus]
MMDHGWSLMSDPSSDAQPDPVPMFSASANDLNPANLSAKSVPPFTCPRKAFTPVEKSPKYFEDKASVYFKPLHFERYNALMRSIDKTDQLLEPYAYKNKPLALFKKLGIHFIFRALLNSFLAYCNTTPTYKKDFVHFILEVLDDLAAQYSTDAKAIVKKDQEQIAHPNQPPQKKPKSKLLHCLIPFTLHKKQKSCRICSKKFSIRKNTIYHCPRCPGDPALCCNSHYMAYHEQDEPKTPKLVPRNKGPKKGEKSKKPWELQPGPSGAQN